MMRTITPNTLDEMEFLLGHEAGRLTVYFPLFDSEQKTADYVAEISWSKEQIEYTVGGHGIGSNRVQLSSKDALVDQIIADNKRFNSGNAFHIEGCTEEMPQP